jgi:hypothetical protein
VPRARLQLRWVSADYAERLYGVEEAAGTVLEELCAAVNGYAPHQLLGWPPTVQDDPRGVEAATEVLLHLGTDHALRFSPMDAGSLMVFGDPADLRAARWERATVWPSSC